MKRKSLKKRFTVVLALYTIIVLTLWFGYHSVAFTYVSENAKENINMAADKLLTQIGDEFSHMKVVASVIAGSTYMQEFLAETDVAAFYEKANTVSEIVQKSAYPITSSDSIIAISNNGDYYRFTGGLSNAACKNIFDTFKDGNAAVYTIIDLDNTLYFCHISPVMSMSGQMPKRIGSVVILNGLTKIRRVLSEDNKLAGVNTAVILDGKILLSDKMELEGREANVLETQYGAVTISEVSGTKLFVAAAVEKDMLFAGEKLFLSVSLIMVALLLLTIALLYRFISAFMINPMLDTTQKMQIGLLSSQIDAHFVVNSISCIQGLAQRGDNEKAASLSEGLATILKHLNTGESLVNIFVELEMLERYIDIMNTRHDNKYTASFEVDDNLSECLMQGLILQPIIENAFTHGLQNKASDCSLTINGKLLDDTVSFEIADNGAGIAESDLDAINKKLEMAHEGDFPERGLRGVALVNIQKRIRLSYGARYGVSIESAAGKGTTVTITLPVIEDK